MSLPIPNNIALLIDADNAPAAKIDFILSELAAHGVVNIRRAYGNWTKADLRGWIKVLNDNSIQPMQSFDLVKGKNATDMALVIDAMDLLYTKSVHTFSLVSSDCDFTPLIQRLRADGKEVFGFGELKTPASFIAACTRFIYLDNPKPAKLTAPKPKPGQSSDDAVGANDHNLKGNTKLINTLRNAVKASADDEGWANLSNIANRINNESPFDHRTYGFKKLVDLFEAIDLFEVKREKATSHTVISIRIAKVGGKKLKLKPNISSVSDDDDVPI
ncbi:MAG: NYN domain-containing protein [Verrucomicrobiota bacterium]